MSSFSHNQTPPPPDLPPVIRRGVVGVIVRAGRFLVIRRSETVAAPGAYCFPGGGIEPGESEPTALCRELQEELSVVVTPVKKLWESRTHRGVHLAWWSATLAESETITPNPAEVAAFDWHEPTTLDLLEHLLDSNREFLAAWRRREFHLDLLP